MNTNSIVLFSGALVIVGRIIQGKPQTARVVVGMFFIAVFLSVISETNEKLGQQFALLVLIVAAVGYAPDILSAIGYPVEKKYLK